MNELIAWAVAVVVALVGAWAMGRGSAKNKQVKDTLEAVKKSKVNYEEVQRMDDDSLANEFDRLRDKRR